jgi:hypothetical protein
MESDGQSLSVREPVVDLDIGVDARKEIRVQGCKYYVDISNER